MYRHGRYAALQSWRRAPVAAKVGDGTAIQRYWGVQFCATRRLAGRGVA